MSPRPTNSVGNPAEIFCTNFAPARHSPAVTSSSARPGQDGHRALHASTFGRKPLAFLYRARNAIERMFCRLKDSRRIATRYDRLATNFLAVCLAATLSY